MAPDRPIDGALDDHGRAGDRGAAAAILMVGAAIDQQTLDQLRRVDPLPQVQTHRFQWAIIHAIETAAGQSIDVISTVPTRDYPFSRRIFWPYRRARLHRPSKGQRIIMPLVNLLLFKQLTRFSACLLLCTRWRWQHRVDPNQRIILSYGLIVPHLLAAWIVARCSGARLVAILTDPPRTYHDENAIYRAARRADRWLLKAMLSRLDGLIVLTPALARDLAPGVRALVMEGIVSDQVMQYAGHPRNGEGARPRRLDNDPAPAAQPPAAPFAIMYAGQLHRDYGTQILLDAFAQLAPGDGPFQLWICGRGTMESHVRRAAAADPRITYHGFVDDDALFTAMARASVLVNPRPFDPAVSPYSFPSKLLEYMAMGKIVICAKLPGIPPEYYPHLVLVDNMTPCALARQIRQVATWSPQRRCDMARRAAQFVFSSKTQLHQGRRIVDFLGSLGERTTRLGSG